MLLLLYKCLAGVLWFSPLDFQDLLFDLVKQAIVGALEVDEVVSFLSDLCNALVNTCHNGCWCSNDSRYFCQDLRSVFPSLLADILAIAGENNRLSVYPQHAKMSMDLIN